MSLKKVALCLTGDVRNDMAGFSYIYESFLSQSGNTYEIDVYISSWDNMFRSLKIYKPKDCTFDFNPNESFRLFLNGLNSQTKKIVNKYTNIDLTHSIHPLKNTFLMSLANMNCFNIIKKKYDFYIKCRFDLFFTDPIDLNNILQIINGTNYNSIATLTSGPNIERKINDQMFIGNYDSFKIYCNFVNYLEDGINETNSISPEVLLTHYLKDKISPFFWNFKRHIIRGQELILDPPYQSHWVKY